MCMHCCGLLFFPREVKSNPFIFYAHVTVCPHLLTQLTFLIAKEGYFSFQKYESPFSRGLKHFICLFGAALKAYESSQAESELSRSYSCQPTPATATQDPSPIFNLHHSSWQHQILNPLSEASHQTCILMDTSQICFC